MTLSVKILTFMASQADKVVPKHHNSFTRRKIGMRKKFAGRGALEGPRGSTRAPTSAEDVDISSYVDRENCSKCHCDEVSIENVWHSMSRI